SRRMLTNLDPMRPLPPITTIFISCSCSVTMETKRHSPLRAVASIGAGASVLACHGATWMLATSIDAAVASNTSQPRQTLHEGFIDKTPAPDFAGFHRSDDGMRRGMKVRS